MGHHRDEGHLAHLSTSQSQEGHVFAMAQDGVDLEARPSEDLT